MKEAPAHRKAKVRQCLTANRGVAIVLRQPSDRGGRAGAVLAYARADMRLGVRKFGSPNEPPIRARRVRRLIVGGSWV